MSLRLALSVLLIAVAVERVRGEAAPEDGLVATAEARAALDRACEAMRAIATEGGFLWRYSADLRVRRGEGPATATQVWVQAPGTPAVGEAFLEAWQVTGDPVQLEAARAAAQALVRGQLHSGGWDYRIEFDPARRCEFRYRSDPASAAAPKARNITTFDDNTTQGALLFLLRFLEAARPLSDPRDAPIQDALDFGLRQVIVAQYSNGAWPQRWDGAPHAAADDPVRKASIPETYPREQPSGSYYAHYTFNDGAHRDLVMLMLEAARRTGRAEYRACAQRGVDFLLLAQLPEPQPGWAQQYDARMHPAWARAFEPPAVSSAESAGVIRLLIDAYVEFGDERYRDAIVPAVAWLRRSEIAPGRWARLYELQTNRPIYGDRDRQIHYTLAEISEERRRGYGWEGDFNVPEAIVHFERLVASGRETYARKRAPAPLDDARRAARLAKLAPAVRRAIATLGKDGHWLTDDPARRVDPEVSAWIDSAVFIRNARLLCEYLSLAKQP